MELRNTIVFGKLKKYDGKDFAVIELPQFDDDPEDRKLEDILILTPNSKSQNLPHVNDNVAIAFDNDGEGLLLGAYHAEISPRPETEDTDIVSDNGQILIRLTGENIEIKNQNNELIDLIIQLFDLLLNSTTATGIGAQKLSIALPDATTSLLGQLKSKVESFKVT